MVSKTNAYIIWKHDKAKTDLINISDVKNKKYNVIRKQGNGEKSSKTNDLTNPFSAKRPVGTTGG